MDQTKILVINYYWPPCGGSAVQRWLSFVKNLDKLGIIADVISIKPEKAAFPFIDNTLLNQIPESTKVYKTDSSDLLGFYINKINKGKVPSYSDNKPGKLSFLKKSMHFVRGNFFLPDPKKGWNKHAFAMAEHLIKKNNYAAVITAGPPQSTHLVGIDLKEKFPYLKWIADFHDYWTDIFSLKSFYRTQLATFFDRKMEAKVLKKADHILLHCNSAFDIYKRRVKNIEDKLTIITMGYDDEVIKNVPFNETKNEHFVIAYTGIITKEYEPEFFLKAVMELINDGCKIKLVFAGNIYPELIDHIEHLGLNENFAFLGYLPHAQSVELIKKSDLLLLINPLNEYSDQVVPGKIYEYLAVNKPILNIAGTTSENKKIIDAAAGGFSASWHDIPNIKKYISMAYQDWTDVQNDFRNNKTEVEKNARSNQALVLKKIIEN